MLRFLTGTAAAIILSVTAALAQVFPDPTSTTVNDFADMLTPEVEARIEETLTDAARGDGAEVTVVTLSSVRFYANDMSVPDYATALFNAWGVGDADDGNGILLIVFRDDRQLRIETGTSYDAAAQDKAQVIISEVIIPEFQNADFEAGIEKGATALVAQLVKGDAPAARSDGEGGSSSALYWIIGVIGAGIAGIIGLNKRRAAKLAATPCPSCGKTELSEARVVTLEPTETTEGKGETQTTCGACGHMTAKPYTISAKGKPDAKPKFDGGKSDGGGASGKW